MTMPQLLETLLGKGYTVSLRGETINIKPIPDAQTVENLRQHKAEIIRILSHDQSIINPTMGRQVEISELATWGMRYSFFPCSKCGTGTYWFDDQNIAKCAVCFPPIGSPARWIDIPV